MKIKTKIIHQYELPIGLVNILALPCGKCVGFGVNKGLENKFVILTSGTYRVLDYEIPKIKHLSINHRGALFETNTGFGCVFDKKVVKYSFDTDTFEEYSIKTPLPIDQHGRDIGPLKASVINHENNLLVLQEDFFYKFKGRYISKLNISPNEANYERFFFSTPAKNPNIVLECCDVHYQDKILFHTNNYSLKLKKRPNDCSQFCELRGGEVAVISETSKGLGSFSSDRMHLMIKTYDKPYQIEFYLLSGEKDFEIKLTLKKVLGNVDKVNLTNFDKIGSKLWLCNYYDVTEVELFDED
jgi:hypothetical protein